MRAVDTDVIVRLMTRDDPRQTASAEAFISQGAWVSTLALAEAIWVLGVLYKKSSAQVASTIEMLLNHRHLVVQDSDTVAAALELFRSRPALGFPDCLMLEVARKAGHLPLGTFDRSLGKMAGAFKI